MVGLLDAAGARTVGFGSISPRAPHPPDGQTGFEIGSVTVTTPKPDWRDRV